METKVITIDPTIDGETWEDILSRFKQTAENHNTSQHNKRWPKADIGPRTPIELSLVLEHYIRDKTVCHLGHCHGDHFYGFAASGAKKIIGIDRASMANDEEALSGIRESLKKLSPHNDFEMTVYFDDYWDMLRDNPVNLEADVYYAWGFGDGSKTTAGWYDHLVNVLSDTYCKSSTDKKYLISYHASDLEAAKLFGDVVIHFESLEWIKMAKHLNNQHNFVPPGVEVTLDPRYANQNIPPYNWSKDVYLGVREVTSRSLISGETSISLSSD